MVVTGMDRTLAVTRPLAQRLVVILAVVVQIGATFLPQLGFGEPIGNRSDSVRTLVTPSGWAFAIWGLLFTGSAVFALWQALPAQRNNALLARIAWPAAVALAAQGVWATYTQFANLTAISAVIILISLGGLLIVLRTLVTAPELSRGERWLVAPVFSALAAWLTAASIVNISASLKYHGIGGGVPQPLVAAAMVVIGAGIAAVATARVRGAPFYGLVFCWALLAIYARGGQQFAAIGWAAMAGGAMVLAALGWRLMQPANRRHWFGA
jgi:hypothetical protein